MMMEEDRVAKFARIRERSRTDTDIAFLLDELAQAINAMVARCVADKEEGK